MVFFVSKKTTYLYFSLWFVGTVNQLFREPEKPTLVIEKREPIVNAGGSAMLELQVKGYPKPQVRFKHEGKSLEAGEKYK